MTFLLQQVLCHLDIKSVPALILDDDGKNIHVILRASESGVFVDPLYAWMYLDNDGTPMAAEMILLMNGGPNALNCKEIGILNYPIVPRLRVHKLVKLWNVGGAQSGGSLRLTGKS